jgi:hypothetical protein
MAKVVAVLLNVRRDDVCCRARLGSSDKDCLQMEGPGSYWLMGKPQFFVNIGKEQRYDEEGWGYRPCAGHQRCVPCPPARRW